MRKWMIGLIHLLCAINVFAVSGRVVDELGVAVEGAKITNTVNTLTTLSDVNGLFDLDVEDKTVSLASGLIPQESINIIEGVLFLELTQASDISILILTSTGSLEYSRHGAFEAGAHQLPVPLASLPSGQLFIQVRLSGEIFTSILLNQGAALHQQVRFEHQSMAATLSAIGELNISKLGYISTAVAFGSDEEVVGDVELKHEDAIVVVESFTDARDNHVYKKVIIGTQVWMAENLAYLPQVDAVADGSEDVASGKYYYVYDYIPTGSTETEQITNAKLDSNYQTDGVLYNWYAAMDGATSSILAPSGVQGVCPSGWHLPSDAEWTILNDYVDANNGSDGIGNSLKATTGWNVYSGVTATDQFGFSALPASYRNYAGDFSYRGNIGYWWSASEYSSTSAYYRYLYYYRGDFYQSSGGKSNGFSVRCLEDTP